MLNRSGSEGVEDEIESEENEEFEYNEEYNEGDWDDDSA